METTVVTLAPLLDSLVSLLLAALLAAGTWAIRRALAWPKLSEDAKVREYLDEALLNGIDRARRIWEDDPPRLEGIRVRSEIIASAAQYAIDRVPDALRRFGIDENGVRDLVIARLRPEQPRA